MGSDECCEGIEPRRPYDPGTGTGALRFMMGD